MWNRVIKIYCKQCHKSLGENTLVFHLKSFKGDLIEGGRRTFCNEKCYNKYLQKYFVEEYKNHKIYWTFRDGQKYYIPYVGCGYGFKTTKDCRGRIDANHIGVYV